MHTLVAEEDSWTFLDPWTYLWTHFLQSPEPCLFKGFGCILVDLPSALAFLLPAQPIHPSIPFHFPLSFSTLHLSNTPNHFHNNSFILVLIMTSSRGPEIQKLGPSNYNQWSGEMQAWLRANQLWQIVSGQKPRPTASSSDEKLIEKQEAWDDKAEKAAVRTQPD